MEGFNIKLKMLESGFEVEVFDKEYKVNYPAEVFGCLSDENKNTLAENFIFSRLSPLGLYMDKIKINWGFKKPFFYNFVDFGLKKDFPRISQESNVNSEKLEKLWGMAKKNFSFNKGQGIVFNKVGVNYRKSVLAMSFGKDSLLSYGLLKELGFDVSPVFVREMENINSREMKEKENIMRNFENAEKTKVNVLYDNIDEVFYKKDLISKIKSVDNANAMLAFSLELLPFAYFNKSRYICFGNEQNFNDTFVNKYKQKAYSSFDQSSAYMNKMNKKIGDFTKNSIRCLSLVEPIYNIAEYKILFNRYPNLLKYIMSCDLEKQAMSGRKWCLKCTMCATSYLYPLAIGGDALKIGIKENMLQMKYKNLYPLFGGVQDSYDLPDAIKEEQMLAFLLAMRNGAEGGLIELFKKKFLKQALKKEGYLKKKYFGIHSMKNIPNALKPALFKILKQELKSLQ